MRLTLDLGNAGDGQSWPEALNRFHMPLLSDDSLTITSTPAHSTAAPQH